ncbi:hypothetical protein OVY48_06955 [Sphingobium sp. SA2]|jgi:hypothetical protein|uniref:hypothetical protein n=1 Tax=Sphingobium sp. SA2 TaxID=1524832 RepID=UPI0028C00682|nr:hypothetical protein [Sphingobium sp. SA2]MDT7533173.1 hypothetical protein [Sphingobium sp. SA2]
MNMIQSTAKIQSDDPPQFGRDRAAAWLIAALMVASGGIVARLILDYPMLLPNSYVGFVIYRCAPASILIWACAGATIAVSPAPRLPVLLIALCGSIAACFALSGF